uniref:Ribosomal protein L28 n=1 Tax=Romanomermis culicivorax TaxID=13658 RepID=A0A915JXD3_ROMCU
MNYSVSFPTERNLVLSTKRNRTKVRMHCDKIAYYFLCKTNIHLSNEINPILKYRLASKTTEKCQK